MPMPMPRTELSPAHRQWRVRIFSATWLSYFGYYFCRKPFFAAKQMLSELPGWTDESLAWVGVAYLVSYAAGQFISAALGPKYGARILLLLGMSVSIGCNIVFGLSTSVETFIGFMVVNGLAQSTGWSANVAAMAPWFRRNERGTVMGFWATNFQIGGTLASILSGVLLASSGISGAFAGGAVVLLAITAFFVFNQRNRPEDVGLSPIVSKEESGEDAEGGISSWSQEAWTNVLLLGVFYFFVKFIRYALISWTPLLLMRFHSLGVGEANFVSTAFEIAGAVGVIVLGVCSDRFLGGKRIGISLGFMAIMVVGCGLLYMVGGQSVMLFGTVLAVVGFGLFGPDAVLTSAGAIDVGSVRSAALSAGIINGMGQIGGVAQEFVIAGMVGKDNMSDVFAVLVASSAGAMVMLIVLLIRNRRGMANL
jgi:sugar phosphate permease